MCEMCSQFFCVFSPFDTPCIGGDRGTDHGKTIFVGCHSFSARSAMRLAVIGAKRQLQSKAPLPPALPTPHGRCHRVCRMRMAKHKMQESGTTVVAMLHGLPGSNVERDEAEPVATLEVSDSGTYWASWADAFHMVGKRNPEVADMVVRTLSQRKQQHAGCLAKLHQATARLDREGLWWRPTWQALRDGARGTCTQYHLSHAHVSQCSSVCTLAHSLVMICLRAHVCLACSTCRRCISAIALAQDQDLCVVERRLLGKRTHPHSHQCFTCLR